MRRPASPRPFTLSVDDAAVSTTLAQALFRPSAPSLDVDSAPQTLTFEYQDASGLTATKEFSFRSRTRPTSCTSRRASPGASRRARADGSVGAGDRYDALRREYARLQRAAAADLLHRWRRRAHRDARSVGPRSRTRRARYGFAGVDDHYFMSRGRQARPVPVRLQYEVVPLPRRRDPARAAAALRLRGRRRSTGAPSGAAFFFGPEGLRRPRRDRSRAGPGDRLRHVLLAGRAAAARAEVGQRLHRQLRLVDHRAHGADQRGHVPAAAQERRLDAPDAGDSAGDESDPGSLREAEDDRPGAAEDEQRDDGSSTRSAASIRRAAACRCC